MENLQIATEQVETMGPRQFRVKNVAEIIVGPNGVGIRHRIYERNRPFESDTNQADVRWAHRSGPCNVSLRGPIKGSNHLNTPSGVAAVYMIGGADVMVRTQPGGAIKITVEGGEEKSGPAAAGGKGNFVISLFTPPNGVNDFPVHDELNVVIAKASDLLKAAPGMARVVVGVQSSPVGLVKIWSDEK